MEKINQQKLIKQKIDKLKQEIMLIQKKITGLIIFGEKMKENKTLKELPLSGEKENITKNELKEKIIVKIMKKSKKILKEYEKKYRDLKKNEELVLKSDENGPRGIRKSSEDLKKLSIGNLEEKNVKWVGSRDSIVVSEMVGKGI